MIDDNTFPFIINIISFRCRPWSPFITSVIRDTWWVYRKHLIWNTGIGLWSDLLIDYSHQGKYNHIWSIFFFLTHQQTRRPTKRWANVVLMLGQRRRRWTNNKATLDWRLMLARYTSVISSILIIDIDTPCIYLVLINYCCTTRRACLNHVNFLCCVNCEVVLYQWISQYF